MIDGLLLLQVRASRLRVKLADDDLPTSTASRLGQVLLPGGLAAAGAGHLADQAITPSVTAKSILGGLFTGKMTGRDVGSAASTALGGPYKGLGVGEMLGKGYKGLTGGNLQSVIREPGMVAGLKHYGPRLRGAGLAGAGAGALALLLGNQVDRNSARQALGKSQAVQTGLQQQLQAKQPQIDSLQQQLASLRQKPALPVAAAPTAPTAPSAGHTSLRTQVSDVAKRPYLDAFKSWWHHLFAPKQAG